MHRVGGGLLKVCFLLGDAKRRSRINSPADDTASVCRSSLSLGEYKIAASPVGINSILYESGFF